MSEEETSRILSDLETLLYCSNEYIQGRSLNMTYLDFYKFYNEFIKTLRKQDWNNIQIEEEIKKFPSLPQSIFMFNLILAAIGLMFLILLLPYFFFNLVLLIPFVLFIIIINCVYLYKIKNKLFKVIRICSSLKKSIAQY